MAELKAVQALTLEDFIKVYRPDGLGHIVIDDFEGKSTDISFSEVVCDICNAEIIQPEDDPYRATVFVLDGYALCEKCMHTAEDEGEEPSLLIEALEDYRRWFDGDDPSDIEKTLSIIRSP